MGTVLNVALNQVSQPTTVHCANFVFRSDRKGLKQHVRKSILTSLCSVRGRTCTVLSGYFLTSATKSCKFVDHSLFSFTNHIILVFQSVKNTVLLLTLEQKCKQYIFHLVGPQAHSCNMGGNPALDRRALSSYGANAVIEQSLI